jgi:hypothetical protein
MRCDQQASINDCLVIPAGEYPASLRLLAIFGVCPTAFGGNGEGSNLARAALMWVVRLPDGVLGSMCHLVTLDPKPRSQVRRIAAALLGDPSLLDSEHLADGGRLLGRSCLLTVTRQWCGGRDRPTVWGAKPLPAGVAPVTVADPVLWTPKDDPMALPPYFPQKFRTYANIAVREYDASRRGRKVVTP